MYTELFTRTEEDIKNYVRSLDRPDNAIYRNNEVLILSCFSKALEIMEKNYNLLKASKAEAQTDSKNSCGDVELIT